MTRLTTFSLASVLLLFGCSIGETQSLMVNTMAYDDLQGEVAFLGYTSTGDFVEPTSFGIFYETTTDESTSYLLGVESRDYDDAKGTELSLTHRNYFSTSPALRPFMDLGLRYGLGLDLVGFDSDGYAGYRLAAGVRFGLASTPAFLEASVAYEGTVLNPEWPGMELGVSGLAGFFGFGIDF